MKKTAELLRTDGTRVTIEPKNTSNFSLEELQGYVGGYIEVVYVGNGQILIVDEEGLLKKKPVNQTATYIYHSTRPLSHNPIVGDAVFCNQSMVK